MINNIKKNMLKSAQRNGQIKYFSDQLDLYKDNLPNSWKVLKASNKSVKMWSLYVNDKLLLIVRTLLTNLTIYLCQLSSLLTEKIASSKNPLSNVDGISNTIDIFMYLVRRLNMSSLHLKIIVRDGMKFQPL